MSEEPSSAGNERQAVRPWHRSPMFWLGIPGLLFLSWASLGNPSRFGMLDLRLGEHSVRFMDRELMLQIRVEIPKTGPLEPFAYRFVRPTIAKPLGESPDRFPPGVRSMGWNSGRRGRSADMAIAYWLLVAVYIGVWGVTLAWWQRRKARLAMRRH